jgi:arabinose-5-phosphate isomerase
MSRPGYPGGAADARPFRDVAREVLECEAGALSGLGSVLDEGFEAAVGAIYGTTGRVLVAGVGKSGLVAAKIASTFRSTGTPALFIHPVEAMHGDLGIAGEDDLALLLSKSGESEELLRLLPTLRRLGVPVVAVTCQRDSSLARSADHRLCLGPLREAGPIDLVPTTSTTAMMALGDAIAVALLVRRGFRSEHFAFLHPGGVIGRKVLLRVEDLMHSGDRLPCVSGNATVREAILEMTAKRLGMTAVVDGDGRLAGILTDGDLRRILQLGGEPLDAKLLQVMTRHPKTIGREELVVSALRRMEENPGGPITSLLIVDDAHHPVGVIHLHDCLRARP